MVLRKDQLEASLHEEKKLIEDGRLKEDNPLDLSESFCRLCEACRRGDLKVCQEMITEGANINARDQFDYTPLILASLCGHFEVVQLLLESGALCERDTFQGERCLYNALNDKIRNLLLSYDYSKATDPLQPLASHINSLLTRDHPQTSDISVTTAEKTFNLHKFLLSARSPYFRKKLSQAPETASWKLPPTVPLPAFETAIRYVYFGEIPNDIGGGPGTGFTEDEVLQGVDRISRQLEVQGLWEGLLEGADRRLARQRRTEEVEKGRDQLEAWYRDSVLKHKVFVDTEKADGVRWDRDNGIFADALLRADEAQDNGESDQKKDGAATPPTRNTLGPLNGIPVGPVALASRSPSRMRKRRQSTLFPVHRAMLLRSEFFLTMFSSSFREAQHSDHLQIIPIDCSPDVLEVVLTFLYTEKADFSLDLAIDVLFAADLLLIEKLKIKAAVVISTLGNGTMSQIPARLDTAEVAPEQETIDIYDVIRAGWLTRVPRLEEFGARYFAYRLENYIDEDDFADLIRESAARIKGRQETDSIELIDDIRYYLSERFRLRFEDSGIEDMMDESEMPKEPVFAETLPSVTDAKTPEDEGIDVNASPWGVHASSGAPDPSANIEAQLLSGAVRTLDGELAGDELAADAMNYQILLGKIDALLDKLKLDA